MGPTFALDARARRDAEESTNLFGKVVIPVLADSIEVRESRSKANIKNSNNCIESTPCERVIGTAQSWRRKFSEKVERGVPWVVLSVNELF